MTITVNGQPYELTEQNYAELDRQHCISMGQNIIDFMVEYIDECASFSEEDYYEIGYDFVHGKDYDPEPEYAYYNILERYGLLKEEE